MVFTNSFSEEVWNNKYKFTTDNTIQDTWKRVAKEIASVEEDKERWAKEFYKILSNFQFVPGGRITANAGTGYTGTTYINCFTTRFEGKDQDSIEGIYTALLRQAQILKSEGGYGFCADVMRPRGAHIRGIANQSPGAVKFLELWDKSSEVITEGGDNLNKRNDEKKSIRKGAQMVTMSCHHPDIINFINAKKTKGRLTKFNMSVLCTDTFMQSVVDDSPWDLYFPNYEAYPFMYEKEWDGDWEKWAELTREGEADSFIIYHTFKSARELWELIMENTYNRNEPGVLFIDTINRMNNLWYKEYINTTNPCCAKGTLVNTPYGYKPVERIKEGDLICTALGSEPVKTMEKHSNYPVYEVLFSDGGKQIVTAAHKYFVKRNGNENKRFEQVSVKDIQIGERIKITPTIFDDSHLSNTEYQAQYKKGLQSGVLLGDGCYTNSKVVKIASNQDDVEYNKNLKELFGLLNFNKDDVSKNSKSISLHLKTNTIDLESLGLQPQYSHEKTINYRLLTNSGLVSGLLDGLLATDGNVNLYSTHAQIRWFTTSEQLAQTIRRCLLYLGCHGVISQSNDKGGTIDGREMVRNHPKYTITICGNSVRNYINMTQIHLLHPQKGKLLQEAQINWSLTGNTWLAKVLSIKKLDYTTDVYDLYCEGSDTWITDGYTQQGCGEQPGENLTCNLGSINLVHFINTDTKDWHYHKLKRVIKTAVRFMDNVNDLTKVALPVHQESLKNKRRIGLGIFGYGSALMMARIRYGSKEALEITEKLMKFITNAAYQASCDLAIEKGVFPLYDKDKYLQSDFVYKLNKTTQNKIKKCGMRNSHVTSIQPTGNSSVFANLISSGLEPVFSVGYYRTVIQYHHPKDLDLPTQIDWDKKTFVSKSAWEWATEGDENILVIKHDNKTWKFDQGRGLLKETWVEDYGVSWLKKHGLWRDEASWATCAMSLKIDDHINTMNIFANWVCGAISKTINLANDYPYEDFQNVYMDAWKNGIKGFTTYRAGTMTTVLSESSVLDDDRIPKKEAPLRPKELECDVHHVNVHGKPYFVLVGKYKDDPYEVFAGINGFIDKKIKAGKIVKYRKKYKAILEDGEEIAPVNIMCDEHQDALTRMTSTSLRHGAEVQMVVRQLEKNHGDMQSFSKAIARALKKYIPDGSKEKGACPDCDNNGSLIRQEGCIMCTNCGFSKCM